jgi:hypothetical protein
MQLLTDAVIILSAFALPHLSKISLAFTATVLATYGDVLNRALRWRIATLPLLVRTAIFVVVVGFGYGALILLASPVVGRLLMLFGEFWLAPLTFGAFVGIGVLAERQKKI